MNNIAMGGIFICYAATSTTGIILYCILYYLDRPNQKRKREEEAKKAEEEAAGTKTRINLHRIALLILYFVYVYSWYTQFSLLLT